MVTVEFGRRARLAAGLLLVAVVLASCGGEATRGEIGTEPPAADPGFPTTTVGATTFEGGPCTAGEHFVVWLEPSATADQFDAVESDLLADPQVMRVIYFDQGDAFREFQDLFADDPEALARVPGPEVLPASYRVVVAATAVDAAAVGEQFVGRPGVREVRVCTDDELARAELVGAVEDLDEAISELAELAERDPEHVDDLAEALVARAFALGELGRFAESLADATSAIELQPSDASVLSSAYINRARANSAMGQFEQAIEDATAWLELAPDDPEAYVNRSQALIGVGRFEEAEADAAAAIGLAADAPDTLVAAYLNRSAALGKLDRLEEAIEAASAGIALGPTDPNILASLHGNRAFDYLALGLTAEASADYETVVDLLPPEHPGRLFAEEQLATITDGAAGDP